MRRWWQRHGLPIILTGLVFLIAWFLRQSNGAVISEVYALLSRPFQVQITLEQRLTNARIEELEERVAELTAQNQNLKQLVGYFEKQEEDAIAAPVIGRSADYWWNQVMIGRGSQEGISPNDVVTGVGGLVGRVIEVTPHSSRLLLISDPQSRVGVMVSRSRQLGYIQGQGSQDVVMRFFEKVPDVKVGDSVTTSAVSRLFPGDIPIGRVKALTLESGPAPEVVVEVTAPLNYLEWVVVHPFEPLDFIIEDIPQSEDSLLTP